MNVFDLFARLTLDTSEYERDLGGARDKASSAGGGIGSALKGGLKVAGAALAAGGAAVTAFAKSSVDAGSQFDSAMAQVAATSGKSMDELTAEVGTTSTAYGDFTGNLRDFAQFLGSETSFSATQAAEALNYMALAGYDAQQSMNMLPTVLDLAAAGGIDLAYASDMVTDAQSALGLTAEETAEMVDKMALTSSKTNTSVSQLGEAILQIGATARSAKGGTTELSTVLGVLADNGIKGAEGGTHLRNIIMSLQNPTKDGVAALEALGVSVYDADGNMRSMVDIVADMQKGLGGMDQASRDAMINGIFNKTDAAAVNALLNTTQDRFATLTGQIDNATGAAQRMAATQLDNLAGDTTLFQSALEGAKIAISDGLTPTLRNFVQFGTTAVSELGTAFKEDGLQGALNALGPVINQGVDLIFSALPNVLNAATSLLTSFGTAIIQNLPKLIPAGIQIVTTLVASLVSGFPELLSSAAQIIKQISDGIMQVLPLLIPAAIQIISTLGQGIVTMLPELATSAIDMISTLTKGIQENLPQLIPAAMAAIMQFSGTLRENFGNIVDAGLQLIMTLADALIQNLPVFIETVPTIVSNIAGLINDNAPKLLESGIQLIIQLVAGIVQAVPTLIAEFPKIIRAIFDVITAVNWINLGGTIITGIKNGISGLAKSVPETLKKIGEEARDWLKAIDWKTLGADIIDLIKIGVQSLINVIPNLLKSIGSTAVKLFKEIDWLDLGINVINGIVAGLNGISNFLWEAIKSIGQGIIDGFKSILGIHSPSTVMAEIGEFLISGFTNGISEKVNTITGQIKNLTGSISDIFSNLGSSAAQWGRDLIGNFVDGLNQKLQNLKDKAVGIAQQIKDVIGFSEPKEGPLSNFHTYAPDMMELFAKGIRDNENLITDAIGSSFNLRDQIGTSFGSGTVVSMGGTMPVNGGTRSQTVVLQVGRTELGRLVYELYNEESQRMGVKLAAGGIA